MADYRCEVIKSFKKAIRAAEREGKGMRMASLFGHLNRSRPQREWFMKNYPLPMQHILFIHENREHFAYDPATGYIGVRAASAGTGGDKVLEEGGGHRQG